jgi:hypothetical protein
MTVGVEPSHYDFSGASDQLFTKRSRSILDLALELASQNLPVFPCAESKRPAIAEAVGGHGHLDAVTDPDAVRELFARTPYARLVGVPTGKRSGFDVLDTDPRHGGHLWEAEHAHRLPRTRMHRTRGGGYHRLFRHAEGARNRAGCPVPGVDVRGEGGYVVWPPSTGYSVADDAPIAEWPPWLLEVVRRPPPSRPSIIADPGRITDGRLDGLLRSLLARVSAAPEGQKHDVLRAISRTVGGYAHLLLPHTDAQLTELLLDALPDTVLDWKLARRTAEWGLQKGRSEPLTLDERPLPPRANCSRGYALAALRNAVARGTGDGGALKDEARSLMRFVRADVLGLQEMADALALAALRAGVDRTAGAAALVAGLRAGGSA